LNNTKNSNLISAVVDNNILVDLYELKRLDILFKIFDVVTIPKVIHEMEIIKEVGIEIDKYDYTVVNLEDGIGYMTYYELTNDTRFKRLSDPDKKAISIAKHHKYYFNSNDGLVRKACSEYGVEYISILGVLERAYDLECITKDELTKLCKLLKSDETSCYIRNKLIDDFLIDIEL